MRLKFWGTRGSIPVPGKNTLKYGGNTPCVEIRTISNNLIILDAGSGIRELGKSLINNYNKLINIFISHYHWDHIQGIPFFMPLYKKKTKIVFYGLKSEGNSIDKLLKDQMSPDNFPVEMEKVNAEIKFKSVAPNMDFKINGAVVKTFQANHSSPTLSFKIVEEGKSIVYLTDNELYINPEKDLKEGSLFLKENADLIEFCRNTDYLIHDSMFEESAIKERKGWGHSDNLSIAYFSILTGVKNLLLFHYNPDYSDKKIDKLFSDTCKLLKRQNSSINCIAAKEGLELKV
jgi:phosphoribosyl 1,2-cyclic phosphodiesterase